MGNKDIEALINSADHQINVVDFKADPSGTEDSTEAIWRAFESAKTKQGQTVIDFPKGIYQLQKGTAQKRPYHNSNIDSIEFPMKYMALLLEDQENIIINGNGSLFMINGDCMALAIVRSKNIVLHDFSWDFSDPTTIEMSVKNTGEINGEEYTDFYIPACFKYTIDDNQRDITWYSSIDPQTDDYYWTDKNHCNGWTVVGYHPDRDITRRYSLEFGPFSDERTRITQESDSVVRIFYKERRPFLHKEGFVIQFNSTPKRETAGAFIWESEDTFVSHVNVHYMHGFAWLTQMSHNVTYKNCIFKTREETERYTSSYADLIHVSGASGHIQIEGCTFSQAHDDPINIHGTFTRVENRIDENTLELRYIHRQQGGFPQYYVGNEVMFYRRDTLTNAGELKKPYTVTSVSHPGENGNDLRSTTVTFDRPLPKEIMDQVDGEQLYVAENITFTPSVHISDNLFETISTRGILCTTSKKVVIEKNTFKHMAMDAIYLSNDSEFWYESGPLRDVTIKENIFYVAKVGNPVWRNAAIRIHPITMGDEQNKSVEKIHENITIINNDFYLEDESALVAKSVDRLVFKNNRIHSYQPEIIKSMTKSIVGEEPGEKELNGTFELVNAKDVIISDNQFIDYNQPTLTYHSMDLETISINEQEDIKLTEI